VPRKVGLPVLPIFEGWRAGTLSIRKGRIPSRRRFDYRSNRFLYGSRFLAPADGMACRRGVEAPPFMLSVFGLVGAVLDWNQRF
jgi:hypothetical protein